MKGPRSRAVALTLVRYLGRIAFVVVPAYSVGTFDASAWTLGLARSPDRIGEIRDLLDRCFDLKK